MKRPRVFRLGPTPHLERTASAGGKRGTTALTALASEAIGGLCQGDSRCVLSQGNLGLGGLLRATLDIVGPSEVVLSAIRQLLISPSQSFITVA